MKPGGTGRLIEAISVSVVLDLLGVSHVKVITAFTRTETSSDTSHFTAAYYARSGLRATFYIPVRGEAVDQV